jgi:hypothetical protein
LAIAGRLAAEHRTVAVREIARGDNDAAMQRHAAREAVFALMKRYVRPREIEIGPIEP